MEQFLEAQKRLTLEGNIVISVGLFGHFGDDEVWIKCNFVILYKKVSKEIEVHLRLGSDKIIRSLL